MQFPESWLRTFCNPPLSTTELAQVLTMAGLEVEDMQTAAPAFSGVVVAEIKALAPHPNAERLRICQVDAGQSELLTIVCGAANARVGMRVPCALVGACLPATADGKELRIQVGKLRGVESYGMLCSARELQLLGEAADGLFELPVDAPLGQNIRMYLNLDDTIFTLKLTPNLAHCLSVYGVARELAALTGAPLHTPASPAVVVSNQERVSVTISASDLCGRFSGRVVRNVNAKAATPHWMVDRLTRCGQRSVSVLVDISNYVMFELGRPSHIFDLEKIHGGLHVRWGREGEQLRLLNGSTVTVDGTVGVVADDVQLESLAGIMGAASSAVSDSTRHIYVEAAFWWPRAIAGRARRYNFATDAAHRFERGVDQALTVEHLERITQLILEICGTSDTTCGPVDDQQPHAPQPALVSMRVTRAAQVLGMALTNVQCVQALQRLGLQPVHSDDVITVQVPSYRFDLQIEEDLIEEVARIVGYDNLPDAPPVAAVAVKVTAQEQRSSFAVRRMIAGLGYQETINFSFVDERWEQHFAGNTMPIRLLNPIASHMGVMRSSLLGSLVQVLKFNVARKVPRLRIFELGRVFLRDASVQNTDTTVQGFAQPMRLAGLAYGAVDMLQWGRKEQMVDFFDVKGDVENLFAPVRATFAPAVHPAMHPGRCARVEVHGYPVGFVGELHPQWCQEYALPQAPVLFELDLDALLHRQIPLHAAVPKFQAAQRDVAVVLAQAVSHAALMQSIWASPTQGLLRDAQLFDVYHLLPTDTDAAEGKVYSAAVRLSLYSDEATLTEEQIESAVRAVVDQLAADLGARVRA